MKGDQIVDGHHVLRHVKGTHFDAQKGKVSPDAFLWRKDPNDAADLGWKEYYDGRPDNEQIQEVRATCGRQLKKNHRFAELNCGVTRAAVATVMPIWFEHDPIDPPNPCHAVVRGLPEDINDQSRAAAAVMSSVVARVFPAVP